MHETDTKVINKISMVAMRDEYEKIANPVPAIARTARAARQGWHKAKGLYQKAKDYAKDYTTGLKSGVKGHKKHPLDRKIVDRNLEMQDHELRQTLNRRGQSRRALPPLHKRIGAARTAARKAIPKATVRGNVMGQSFRRQTSKVVPPYAGFWTGVGVTKASEPSKRNPVKAPKAPVVPNRADFINRQ